ncbi:MAG: hypothetical protein B7Z80_14855 [Rhodospirillales bacterium 20-64-7]|nr:MAG: hypothetical protein B7Z80_14855 [Rhodospirillales bacterium 20-64-7]
MASTLTLGNAIVFASTLIKNQRLNVNNQEPGLTMGNIVLQKMLAPPFIWRFNRGNFAIPISTAAGTDYTVTLGNLGRIETQWLTNSSGAILELNGAEELAKVSATRRPTHVAPVYDDNAGTITFRFSSIPDQNYTASFDYQKRPSLMTSSASTFGPVPDEFSYLFNKGYLAEAGLLVNDSRFPIWQRDFVSGLLATQDGLDAQAKAIFLEQMLNVGRTATRSQTAGQSGAQGRGV